MSAVLLAIAKWLENILTKMSGVRQVRAFGGGPLTEFLFIIIHHPAPPTSGSRPPDASADIFHKF